ncbi:MAG: long-chain-fatty-acid--CoA ligase [Deltaproteobacteria bacterium]|nr:long-chain-fatty-acid--CoA ligase [Deltaproteobacteria bacterium]
MEKIWVKNYDPGVPADIDPSEYDSICDVMETACKKFGSRPAFHNMGKNITYSELDGLSKKFASYLQNQLGLSRGDRVAIMMPNILQYPVALFGILRAGMIVVNVNPLYTARELKHQMNDSGAKAIVIFANSAHTLEEVLDETSIEHVMITQVGDMLGFPKSALVNFVLKKVKKMVPPYKLPGAKDFVACVKAGDAAKFKPEKIAHEDIAFLQYTGGTTGVAKGAILTHKNIVANVLQASAWIKNLVKEDGSEIIITPLPLYHIFSLTANCLVYFSLGGLNVLITNPRDLPGFVKELKKWPFTAMTGVNTLFNGLLNTPGFSEVDFSHLHVALGGGMAVQAPVAKRWKEVTGTPLVEAYGLTETSPAACMNPMTVKEYTGYIGLPIPSTEVPIRNDEGKDVPLNEVGEICIRGPQVTQGYWNRPEETAKVMTEDGFFRTGDMGFMNEDGFVKLVDRKKDMINVSGFNVYPNEIEEVAASHEKILEAAAIGVPDEKSGEAVKLFVVKKDPTLTAEEVKDFCKQNLTGYKVPKYIEFRDELPKSNVGKILRKDLRE